ncbi:hypothetical protein LCGC14_1097880 [marine sediment metagenome]|uniref:Uncharacterized protein n=1 Tax=marine sediment metagenome TaxID=412755 RepID=A0A0F9MAJ2_9ZZZZ
MVYGVNNMITRKENFVNMADLIDPNDSKGRSYREVNAEKQHKISIGTLVELRNGVRLFVVKHMRDCDQTPLYSLGIEDEYLSTYVKFHGYPEESLKELKK